MRVFKVFIYLIKKEEATSSIYSFQPCMPHTSTHSRTNCDVHWREKNTFMVGTNCPFFTIAIDAPQSRCGLHKLNGVHMLI